MKFSIKLPKTIKAHTGLLYVRTNFSCTVAQNDSLCEICRRLEKRPQPFCLDWLASLFQISLANTGTRQLKLLFYPWNAWKVLSKPGKSGGFVCICLAVKLLSLMRRRDRCLKVQGLFEVTIHLDQRQVNMHMLTHFCTHIHIEKMCETQYMAVLIVVLNNDCLLLLLTSIFLIP